jgi:hypothetical protein
VRVKKLLAYTLSLLSRKEVRVALALALVLASNLLPTGPKAIDDPGA